MHLSKTGRKLGKIVAWSIDRVQPIQKTAVHRILAKFETTNKKMNEIYNSADPDILHFQIKHYFNKDGIYLPPKMMDLKSERPTFLV